MSRRPQESEFSSLVSRIRSARGLTQEALAQELGVTFSTVNGWERGRHRPSPLARRALLDLARETSLQDELVALEEEADHEGDSLTSPGRGTERAGARLESAHHSRSPAEMSGWPCDRREGKDFYHRVRAFPPEVSRWRQETVDTLMNGRGPFPPVRGGASVPEVRGLLDEGVSHLREVARILAAVHRTPDLGNKQDPVDELIYIILSRKTRESAYQSTFEELKRAFPGWDDLLDAPVSRVRRLVRSGGLEEKKTTSIRGALTALKDEFGACTLDPARSWSDERLEAFLCSLPEIQRKSAFCIMMYAFGRTVFPVDAHVGRILARVGPYRELGLDLDGLDHRRLQAVLADLVPPNLRHGLHVNLIAHGREVCRARSPRCGECVIRGFCRSFRSQEEARVREECSLTAVDLFCGAGGITEGFETTGYRVLAAVDSDPMAMRTYRLNHPSVPDRGTACGDLTELGEGGIRGLTGAEEVDVLISAPPCQGFSTAGLRSKKKRKNRAPDYRALDDDRNHLFECMVSATLELRPRLVLMENVPGIGTARRESTSFLEEAARQLEEDGGYVTTTWKINAAALGVPQDRTRLFLVASSNGALPARPEQEYQDIKGRNIDLDALPPISLGEAIFDLPMREPDSDAVVEPWAEGAVEARSRFRRYLTKFNLLRDTPLLFNHTVRYHNETDLELYAVLKPGEDSVHAVEEHGRADLMRYRLDVFDDKYFRLRADQPSKTIVAHLAKDGNGFIHPEQVRSISIREAARVQSFHDGYAFCGSPTDQWKQIGNAVPPILAAAIASSFRRFLERE